MKRILGLFVLLIPGMAAAQSFVSCPSPCLIRAQITNGALTLVDSSQENVEVLVGATVNWNVSGATRFLVAADYSTAMFGSVLPFFSGTSAAPATGKVTQQTPGAVHYYIYAMDAAGKRYMKDPKIRTTSGFSAPGSKQ